MPDYTSLKAGDRIRLLRVPQLDLEQRERGLREGLEGAGHTADTIERILRADPVVIVDHIDEWGYPWYEYELTDAAGEVEWHSIAIMENDSWEMA